MKNTFEIKMKPLITQRERFSRMLGKIGLMVLLLAFFAPSCKKVVEETGTVGVCPKVVSTDPAAGAINVVTNKKVSIVFSEAMDPATINTSTIQLKQGTNFVLGTVTYSGVTAVFTPSAPLLANTVYTGVVTIGVKDPAKNALITEFTWTFNTGNTPTVVSTDPANGAADVVLTKAISATFSTPMDPLTIIAANYFVKQGTTLVPGTISYSGSTAVFTPTTPLTPNTVYTGTVTSGAKDVAGNAMAANYTWSFSTGGIPAVLSTDPVDGATNVILNKVISSTFNKAMNGATLNVLTFTLKQGANLVPATIGYSGKTATLTPLGVLAVNTLYTGRITTGAQDSAGNSIAADYVWTFTTGNAPVVVATDPANGDLNVPLNKTITVSFSTAMDPATINSNTFIVKQGTTALLGTYSYTGTTASFKPTNPLTVSTAYTAIVTAAVKDVAGNAMGADYNWGFSTNSIPAVTSTDPAAGATNVVLNKIITATFNKAMDPATINATTFLLKQGATVITGTVSYTANTASFAPSVPLSPNLLYSATITTGAKDPTGNALAADYNWTFTTSTLPAVTSTDPASAATGVILNKIITATFNKAMDPTTINVLTFLLKQGATPVVGVVTYSGTTATFAPSADLAANTVYTATITTGAKDPTGNSMLANYVWSFTTTATPPAPLPNILNSASKFGAFGGNAGITNQGINTVINNGYIGTTAASTLITGFHDGLTGDVYTETPLNVGLVTGGIYSAPPAPGTASKATTATTALSDANTAYIAISPASKPGGTDPGAGELGGLTLAPGTYKSASGTFKISNGNLTLDAQGDPNAQWFFQTAAGLTVGIAGPAGARSVNLINGGLAKNVYWYVGSSATINGAGGGTMTGNIIASAGVTFSTAGNAVQTVLNGRAISLVASVTMVNTTINVPN